jgi:hypothetical protein
MIETVFSARFTSVGVRVGATVALTAVLAACASPAPTPTAHSAEPTASPSDQASPRADVPVSCPRGDYYYPLGCEEAVAAARPYMPTSDPPVIRIEYFYGIPCPRAHCPWPSRPTGYVVFRTAFRRDTGFYVVVEKRKGAVAVAGQVGVFPPWR